MNLRSFQDAKLMLLRIRWTMQVWTMASGKTALIASGAKARITLRRAGDEIYAKVEVAAAEMGMGTATTTAIVAAERLGLPLDHVEVGYGDSDIPGA